MKLTLRELGVVGQLFEKVELLRRNLRTPLKPELVKALPGQSVLAIERRAKSGSPLASTDSVSEERMPEACALPNNAIGR